MTEQHFKRILKRYENGTATAEEIADVEAFFEAMHASGEPARTFKLDLGLKNKLYAGIAQHTTAKSKSKFRWTWGIAASLIVLLGVSLFTLFNYTDTFSGAFQMQEDALTIHTQAGEQKRIVLADGSTVILNENSALNYPQTFQDSTRMVSLEGQAFFEVTKNPEHPFIVKSGGLSTKVLGTSFNIIERDTIIEVMVSTGLVNVTSASEGVYLKPNQKVTYTQKTATLTKATVNAELNNLWWKGEVVLEQVQIQELAVALEHIYQIPFQITDARVADMYLYSLRLRQDEPLDDLITRINFINEVHLIKHDHMIDITTH
ncbi:FecR family protein [Formosa algae]|uniref:Ferric-dicitrate binding protein FerR (Iron transport regulator) n=1 Tax=Formosa algae TaxID=225843 RepID=A0A9X0YKM2_9FLAO|nr:FecR domain-containing protein [Formosa algae]MBP1840517.1 ferric-dicitrate binding protein FerR (iron transport regulator) [Formosa algae]MDQ0336070.1 ferric-dicitrate binding protein FerR (iron transport regulator) [Formosa algae]OEI81046.1 hypothetical protein AST99_05125 [Formosa algae]